MMRHLVCALTLALLGGLTLLSPATAQPTPDPGLGQSVGADETLATDEAEVGSGHVDIGPRLVNDRLQLMGRDDTTTPPVWRPLDKLVLRVNDRAQLEAPSDKAYSFLGLEPGTRVHAIPQTQAAQVLWLGWNTQDPRITRTIGRGADLVFLGHQGPGHLHVFIANGFDAPTPLWDSRKPAGQKIFMQTNTHVHANWIFTQPGIHLVEVEVRATDQKTHQPLSARATLRFAVGDAAVAAEARPRAQVSTSTTPTPGTSRPSRSAGAPSSAVTSAVSSAGVTSGSTGSAAGRGGLVWGAVGAGILVVGASLVLVQRQRRLRARAWAEDGDPHA